MVDAIPVEDFCRMIGGQYLGDTEEEGTMEEKMKAEIERLDGLFNQHVQNAKAYAAEADKSKAGALECRGAIDTLRRLLDDDKPQEEPVVPDDD